MLKYLKNLTFLFKKSSFKSFQRPFFYSFSIENNNKNIQLPPPPEAQEQAKKALEESLHQEEQKFSLENKTFSARIGETTLTYTRFYLTFFLKKLLFSNKSR